jgi:hypothetical protein
MESTLLDLLSIETACWTPHLETAGDVCVSEAHAGRKVGFVFLESDNPDNELSRLARLFGAGHWRKVETLKSILAGQGVAQPAQPELSSSQLRDTSEFARQRIDSIAELKTLHYKGAALGMGAASSLISRTRDSEPSLTVWRRLLVRYLEAAAQTFEQARFLMTRYRPASILIYNGRFACNKAIAEAARLLNIECTYHERGATIDRYEIYEKPVHDLASVHKHILEAWDRAGEDRTQIGRSFFERRRKGDGIGWISYTGTQRAGTLPPRMHRRRLVYFSSSEDEYAAVGDLVKHRLFASQRHAVEFLVDWIGRQADTELVVRVHPHLRRKSDKDRAWWHSLHGPNVILVRAEDPTDSYALALSADLVLTYGSTMGVEATFMGKPVVLLADSAYQGQDCAHEPGSQLELLHMLGNRDLPAKPVAHCLPYGYYHLTHGRRFRYFEPTSIFNGKFMGVELSTDPDTLRRFKASVLGKALTQVRTSLRDAYHSLLANSP